MDLARNAVDALWALMSDPRLNEEQRRGVEVALRTTTRLANALDGREDLCEGLVPALAASFLALDPDRLARLASHPDNAVQLDDGSLLRVKRTGRGFRIEHVTRSGDAPPEQVWEVDAQGRPVR